MKYVLSLFFCVVSILSYAEVTDTVFYEFWDLNSLTTIGDYDVTTFGEPVIVNTEKGRAMQFDGVDDAIYIDKNPIGDAKEFTFEVLFKPNGGEPNITNEPRFVCFWDPDDANGPRMTIEIRVTASNEWYFDGFLKTDNASLTLIDSTKKHATGAWMHAAIAYKDSVFTTYVNGQQELSDTVGYATKVFNTNGKTSVGARYNLQRWYNGTIKAIKVTHAALTPAEFFSIPDTVINYENQVSLNGILPEIYPIPAYNELYIRDPPGNKLPESISILNCTGEIICQSKLSSNTLENLYVLNIDNLPKGFYYVGFHYQNFFTTRKICVLH